MINHQQGHIECGVVTFESNFIVPDGKIMVGENEFTAQSGTGFAQDEEMTFSARAFANLHISTADDTSKIINFDVSELDPENVITIAPNATSDGTLTLPPTDDDVLVSLAATQTVRSKRATGQAVLKTYSVPVLASTTGSISLFGTPSSAVFVTTTSGVATVTGISMVGVAFEPGMLIVIHHTTGANNMVLKHNSGADTVISLLNKSGADISSSDIASYMYVYINSVFVQI